MTGFQNLGNQRTSKLKYISAITVQLQMLSNNTLREGGQQNDNMT